VGVRGGGRGWVLTSKNNGKVRVKWYYFIPKKCPWVSPEKHPKTRTMQQKCHPSKYLPDSHYPKKYWENFNPRPVKTPTS